MLTTKKQTDSSKLDWIDPTITWSRADHWPGMDNPKALALVVGPQITVYTLNKVLMDGRSRINILYYNTFIRLGLTNEQLLPSAITFHGILPGKSARPEGQITLKVTFGDSTNFHSETLSFKVFKIQSSYHAILGMTTYIMFMARPFYAYLKRKIPGPRGTITIQGSHGMALSCEKNDAYHAVAEKDGVPTPALDSEFTTQ